MSDISVNGLFDYDKDNLICYDRSKMNEGQPCVLIDKNDGSITHEFFMPIVNEAVDFTVRDPLSGATSTGYMSTEFVKTYNGYAVSYPSIDTIYTVHPKKNTITPSVVRTPPVLGTQPKTILYPVSETNRFFFFSTQEIDYDFKSNRGFGTQYLAFDKGTRECFIPKIISRDYDDWTGDVGVGGEYPAGVNCFVLPAFKLMDDGAAGKLHGKLATLSAGLSENDNPVLVIAEFKH